MLLRGDGVGGSDAASASSSESSVPPDGVFRMFPGASAAAGAFRTYPLNRRTLPPGIPYIIVNEGAERFSYYGMKAILVIFFTHDLGMSDALAREYYHAFTAACYFFPLCGALLAETVLGKYRTIMYFSYVYCGGHLALSLSQAPHAPSAGASAAAAAAAAAPSSPQMPFLFGLGLLLIAVGAGGIKPCVSAVLGDQFCAANQPLLAPTFAAFYLAINAGAFLSTLATPALLEHAGPHVAFGVPGLLMAASTLAMWLGRTSYAHIPPAGAGFVREACGATGRAALAKLLPLFAFFSAFWSLYDQTGSAWVLQAEKMNRSFLGVQWLPSQVACVNPLLILLLVPAFNGFVLPQGGRRVPGLYDLAGRLVRVTPLRKISAGLFLLAASFLLPLHVETRIAAGEAPSIGLQLLAYLVLTSAEVLVSVTGLEFAYTQAPTKMKSAVMALFLASTALGNLFTALVNLLITNADGSTATSDVAYFCFFVALMFVVAVAFVPFAYTFREQTFVQGGEDDPRPHEVETAAAVGQPQQQWRAGGAPCSRGVKHVDSVSS